MLPLWWLSFVDRKPDGDKFLGVSVVRGIDMKDAVRVAHLAGCNPGGEVSGATVPETLVPHELWYKTLNRDQLTAAGVPVGSVKELRPAKEEK